MLQNKLRIFFESKIFYRGLNYYELGCVQEIRAVKEDQNKIQIHARVEGSDNYETSFVFDIKKENFERFDCDCPYDYKCKHMAALGLAFIDQYDELSKNSQSYHRDPQKFFNNLAMQINSRSSASKKLEDNIEDNIFDQPDDDHHNYYQPETHDQYTGLKKLLASIGIDADRLPVRILKEMEEKHTKKSLLPSKKFSPPPKQNFNPEKYHIIIKLNYLLSISLQKNNNSNYSFHESEAHRILEEYTEDLTDAQKELFEILKDDSAFYRSNTDLEKLFTLLKDCGIKIYKNNRHHANEMHFVDSSEKIKAELILQTQKNLFNQQTQHKFIFKLDKKYSDKKRYNLFFGKNSAIIIDGLNISIQKISNDLLSIFSRITLAENYYYRHGDEYEEMFTVRLNEKELTRLNTIIKDAGKQLDFTTKLKPDFYIKNFNQAKPCFVVDYDQKKETLIIKPAIDYSSRVQDISETVYCSWHGGKNKRLQWRPWHNEEKYAMKINEKEILYSPLKPKEELRFFKKVQKEENLGFTKMLKCSKHGEIKIFQFIENHWDALLNFAKNNNIRVDFIKDALNFSEKKFTADFKIDLNAQNDWLWFDAECYYGDDKISIENLKKYASNKKGFLKTADGKILKITNSEELERFLMMLESFYAREQGGFEGKIYHASELKYMVTNSEYYNAKIEKSFHEFIKRAESGKPVKQVKLPVRFKTILRDYQKEGINWFYFLREYRFAGILADDMGLGKTIQALTLLEMEKIQGKPSLVVCPKTLLYNWQVEAEKFTPNLKTLVIDGFPKEREASIKNAKKYDLLITGYATMRQDDELYKKYNITFNYCILDEAQFIKNHTTKNAQIVKKIDADYRLALTGTPLENSVSEIWSIFDFLMPGFLGSYKSFTKKFHNPIMKKSDVTALRSLHKKIKCFMLRRTKTEVLKELPPKIEQKSLCHLETAQNILYQEILLNVKREIFETVKQQGFEKSHIHILAGLMKLRQVCNHPGLLLKNKDYSQYESAKLNMFLELIDEIAGAKKKVLVFSQFTQMLDILANELKKLKINYNYLSGKTKDRQSLVNSFNKDPNIQVFLISLKAGGTGLNLTAADNVIIFDPWWNPSVENQAVDRAHRIGQKNSVNVYRLITKGTIEEKIIELQNKKNLLFNSIVGESKDIFKKLTWEDVMGLFEM